MKKKQYYDGYLINFSSKAGYPTIWNGKQNILLHRYIWQKYFGKIPEGYEILDIENFTEKYGYGSQTGGFDVWFINNQEVEVEPIYNATYETYDYSEPGRVTEVLKEEKGPELKLTP